MASHTSGFARNARVIGVRARWASSWSPSSKSGQSTEGMDTRDLSAIDSDWSIPSSAAEINKPLLRMRNRKRGAFSSQALLHSDFKLVNRAARPLGPLPFLM